MLQLFGVKLHPAIGIVCGVALLAFGIASGTPTLCLVGAFVVFATAWTRIAAHRQHESSPDGGKPPERR